MEREQQLFSLGQQLEVQVRSMESASKRFFGTTRKKYMIIAHISTLFVCFCRTMNTSQQKSI